MTWFKRFFAVPNGMLESERVIHSLKIVLACLIGFLFITYTKFPASQWIIITILVVMCAQINVGSVLQKSYMRFIGTSLGSILAIFTLLVFGDNVFAELITILCAAFFFSYIATGESRYSDAGTLGVVTTVIILINPHPTVITGLERFFEISMGILIAALVSQFILPIHARRHFRLNQVETIRKLRDYYCAVFLENTQRDLTETSQDLDENVIQSMLAQRKLAKEAKREPFGEVFSVEYFKESLWCERDILRSITFMDIAYHASDSVKKILRSTPELQELHEDVCLALERIANNLENQSPEIIYLPSLSPVQLVFEKKLKRCTLEDRVYVDGYLFCMDVLLARMERLITLSRQLST